MRKAKVRYWFVVKCGLAGSVVKFKAALQGEAVAVWLLTLA